MAKMQKNFRLSDEVADILDTLHRQTGKSYTQLIEEAILLYHQRESQDKHQLQLVKEENEKLKMVIRIMQEREQTIEAVKEIYQRFLEEKDRTLEKTEEQYQKLLDEKDQRIRELQSQLTAKKSFWQFWKR